MSSGNILGVVLLIGIGGVRGVENSTWLETLVRFNVFNFLSNFVCHMIRSRKVNPLQGLEFFLIPGMLLIPSLDFLPDFLFIVAFCRRLEELQGNGEIGNIPSSGFL